MTQIDSILTEVFEETKAAQEPLITKVRRFASTLLENLSKRDALEIDFDRFVDDPPWGIAPPKNATASNKNKDEETGFSFYNGKSFLIHGFSTEIATKIKIEINKEELGECSVVAASQFLDDINHYLETPEKHKLFSSTNNKRHAYTIPLADYENGLRIFFKAWLETYTPEVKATPKPPVHK